MHPLNFGSAGLGTQLQGHRNRQNSVDMTKYTFIIWHALESVGRLTLLCFFVSVSDRNYPKFCRRSPGLRRDGLCTHPTLKLVEAVKGCIVPLATFSPDGAAK